MDGNKLLSIDERGNAVEWKVSENDNNIKKINKYRFSDVFTKIKYSNDNNYIALYNQKDLMLIKTKDLKD